MLSASALANNKNVDIPSEMQSLITKFNGPTSYFSIDSIIWKVEVDITRFMALQELKTGDHPETSRNIYCTNRC